MKIKRQTTRHKTQTRLFSGIIALGVLCALSNNGCGDDDDTMATHTGKKGEACETTRDCAPGLACIPRVVGGLSGGATLTGGGTCVVGVFNVARTNKECARTECETTEDCCKQSQAPSSFCDTYKDICEVPNPPQGLCDTYQRNCVCDPNRTACEAGVCTTRCVDDSSCDDSGPNGGQGKCVGGKCGECAADGDCKALGDDQTCVNAKCQAPCKGDGDCDGFDRCVNGKCIDGGCQSSRECIAATRNVEATCGTDGKCIIPCQTDLECSNPTGYTFFSCIDSQCVYTGCETDKDCRLFFEGFQSSGGASSARQHYVCRDKGLPGNIVLSP